MLVILIDDLGFAGTSASGGPVGTPTFDRLASEGLRYNNLHTTAVCAPTRAALENGRNHHLASVGGIVETGTAFPGTTAQAPNSVAPLAAMPGLTGYDPKVKDPRKAKRVLAVAPPASDNVAVTDGCPARIKPNPTKKGFTIHATT